eukprot:gene4735-biopygen15016
MADEQEVTMSASIRTIKGIGSQIIEVFQAAGFNTVRELTVFNCEDRILWVTIESIRDSMSQKFPPGYWRRLMSRCIDVIYRIRSAQASDFVPSEYMCPLTLDWFIDPVVTASGHSYSRAAIEEWLTTSSADPLTRTNIGGAPIYSNVAMKNALDHYRLHYQRFRILD